jgi:hypothetical protein
VLKKGEKLFLEQKVDPSLIGGFVIDIGALSIGHVCILTQLDLFAWVQGGIFLPLPLVLAAQLSIAVMTPCGI